MSLLTAYDKFVQQALKYAFSLWGTSATAQFTSYRTGDDGYFSRGYPRFLPWYIDNGDGTITDMSSGLMWIKDGNSAGRNNGNSLTWAAAVDFALGLTFAGHSDWRLANIKELVSIIDYDRAAPCLNPTYFINTPGNPFWVSTTYHTDTLKAWQVYTSTSLISATTKTLSRYAMPVRLGMT